MFPKKTLYLLDINAYIYRSYHAIKNLNTSYGTPIGAIHGFYQILFNFLLNKKPQYLSIVYDSKQPTFRHKIFSKYKANRSPMPDDLKIQIILIEKIITLMKFNKTKIQGYEADDLIASLASQAEEKNFQTIIISKDKDFFQLINNNIFLWDTIDKIEINSNAIYKKTGVFPKQIVDYMALVGDYSDNVPGIPTIGPKTAASLLKKHKNLKNILKKTINMKNYNLKKKLLSYRDQSLLSKKLVTLNKNAPIFFNPVDFKIKKINYNQLTKIFKKLELKKIIKKIHLLKDYIK